MNIGMEPLEAAPIDWLMMAMRRKEGTTSSRSMTLAGTSPSLYSQR